MSVTTLGLSSSQIADITNYVNSYRAIHRAPPLTWDTTVASYASNWSYKMTTAGVMQHSGNPSYGENLAYLQGYGVEPVALIKKSIDLWYNEVAQYDFSKPGFSSATGHFTCLVWLSSKSFGMGVSINNATNEAYISMNTSPPGNYLGEFATNVLPSTTVTPPIVTPPVILPPIITPPIVTPPIITPPIVTPVKVNKLKIISDLYNVILQVNGNYPKRIIIQSINQIISEAYNL